VLFSLNALTSKGGPGGHAPMQATAEASGLIDIRQLSSQLGIGEEKKKRSGIDDIMNLAGGGAFSPAMNAPVLSAPPVEEYSPPPDAPAMPSMVAPAKSKALIFVALGVGAFLVVAAIGTAVMLTHKGSETADDDKAAASASAATAGSATPSASVATNDTPAPGAADTGSAGAAASPAPTDTATSEKKTPSKETARESAPRESTPKPAATPKETAPAPAPVAAAPAAVSDQPFNMGEAKAKLGSIASSVQSCKRGDATGTGRVVVTFAPSGAAQSATVSGPPFEGTPTGSCVASRFRSARVPAFSGSPFSVSKSFTIN
jgi:hypothetical protein